MVSVISSVDTGLGPVIAQANAPPRIINSKAVSTVSGTVASEDGVVRPRYTEYAKLAKTDDQVSEYARSVREADKALGKVEEKVQDMKSGVLDIIKNYPPFPKGDERADYLMSINGLRKELEAMSVPPLKDGSEPVFYPRESKLPELDPKAASDKELREFADALSWLEEKIRKGHAELKTAFEALPAKINKDLVIPLNGETQAGEVSRAVAARLQEQGLSVLGDEEVLAELDQ